MHKRVRQIPGRSTRENHSQRSDINSSPTMFPSATDTTITGGHFTASQGSHATVTINISGM